MTMNRAIDDRSSAAYFNVRKAGQILGEYIEPGPRDAEETLSRLIAVLDNQDLRAPLIDLNRVTVCAS
jgi:hypothetical protein